MTHTYEIDARGQVCIVRVKGIHKRPEDSITLQKLARSLGAEHGYQRFLFDMRKAKIVTTTLDTFITGTVPVDLDHSQHIQRIALLYSQIFDDQKFLENVAVNRGYQLRVFQDLRKAREWLCNNSKKSVSLKRDNIFDNKKTTITLSSGATM